MRQSPHSTPSPARVALMAALTTLALLFHADPARAQVDLSGNWQPTDSPDELHQAQGPFAADFLGMPLNAQGRALGAQSTGDYQQELQRQCATWLVQYFIEGPFAIQFEPVEEALSGTTIGWHMSGTPDRQPLTIWIDGRAPPAPRALHTLSGYATGQWRGDTLAALVTHLRDGLLVRNGAPASERETFTMFITREGEQMTILGVVRDPVYLAAPFPRARTYRYTQGYPPDRFDVNHCSPAEIVEGLSDGYHASQYLPGRNPQINYMLDNYGIPPAVSLGRPEELYPEFREQLRRQYHYAIPSGYCRHACCAAQGIIGTTCPAAPARQNVKPNELPPAKESAKP